MTMMTTMTMMTMGMLGGAEAVGGATVEAKVINAKSLG